MLAAIHPVYTLAIGAALVRQVARAYAAPDHVDTHFNVLAHDIVDLLEYTDLHFFCRNCALAIFDIERYAAHESCEDATWTHCDDRCIAFAKPPVDEYDEYTFHLPASNVLTQNNITPPGARHASPTKGALITRDTKEAVRKCIAHIAALTVASSPLSHFKPLIDLLIISVDTHVNTQELLYTRVATICVNATSTL